MDYEKEFADRAVAERQAQYSEGTRIEYIADDEAESGIPQGTKGTVDFVDDTGTIFAELDNGKNVSLTYADRNKARVLSEDELAQDDIKKRWFSTQKEAEDFAVRVSGKVYDADFIGGYTVQYEPFNNNRQRTVFELTHDEIRELKERIIDETNNGKGVDWEKFPGVDEYISDDEVLKRYEGVSFYDEDFACNGRKVSLTYENTQPQTVKTNMGEMPIEDYREIAAMQSGFDSYEEMYEAGYRLGRGYDIDPTKTDPVSEKLVKNLRFVWNGMKINGKLYKGSYSMGPYTPASNLPSGTISIYMDAATSHIPRDYAEIKGLSIENDSDVMTDYFDNDTVRITPNCVCYKEALKGFVDMRIHDEKRAVKQYSSLFASHLGTHLEAYYADELAKHRQELAALEKDNGRTQKRTAPQR